MIGAIQRLTKNSIFRFKGARMFVERDIRFARLVQKDLDYFKNTLKDSGAVITDSSELEKYNEEYTKQYKGGSRCVLRPKSATEVAAILSYCNKQRLAVVPQGGRTGLVAGAIPCFDEIGVSMERMKKIHDFSPYTGILKCEAGVFLEEAEKYCGDQGYLFPLDLGARGSCHIGGNLSTNAGGLHYVKYGSLHKNCIGMRVVLADGKILDTLHSHRKDNTGYDLKQLFIGAEGTLGIITDAAILCYPKPASVSLAFLGLPSFDNIKNVLVKARRQFGENLSAIEMIDDTCYGLIQKHVPISRLPFDKERYPFYMLIETQHSGSQAESDDRLISFVDSVENFVENGVIAQNELQVQQIWTTREKIADAFIKQGKTFKYDVSLDIDHFYEIVPIVRKRLGDRAVVGGYGHLGDSNLHMNVSTNGYENEKAAEEVHALLYPYVLEEVAKYGGSISAEHGIGLAKAPYIHLSKSKACLDAMQAIKKVLDPQGIMCPYKVLSSSSSPK